MRKGIMVIVAVLILILGGATVSENHVEAKPPVGG